MKMYSLKGRILSIHGNCYRHSTHNVFRWSAKLNLELLILFCGIDSDEWTKFSFLVNIFSHKWRISSVLLNWYHKTPLTISSLISPTNGKHIYTENMCIRWMSISFPMNGKNSPFQSIYFNVKGEISPFVGNYTHNHYNVKFYSFIVIDITSAINSDKRIKFSD